VRETLWCFLGRVEYRRASAMQLRIRRRLRERAGSEHLLLLEHPPVFTLGRNADASDVKASARWLAERGVAVEETDRGGQVTYHGPGQLVGYPIVNLDPDRRDVRRYVWDLQEVLIRLLADSGLAATRKEGPENIGVWVGGNGSRVAMAGRSDDERDLGGAARPGRSDRKIASIGVHISRWLTTHGFALNVATDLDYFQGIVACGLPQVHMTSIEEMTGRRDDLAEVARRCAGHFGRVFDREMSEIDAGQLASLAEP
jgi:lipoyl(octanoyl) transferase